MKCNSIFKLLVPGTLCIIVAITNSFQSMPVLNGTWEFVGGVYNGKKEGTTTGYTLHRIYDAAHYNAFAIEKGYKTEKYETGNYVLKGDTCIDKETFSSQPSKITNVPIHYLFILKNDTLTLKGTLPTGMVVVEYWKRLRQPKKLSRL